MELRTRCSPLSIRGTGTPIIVAGKVIAGYDNGKLVALDLKTENLHGKLPLRFQKDVLKLSV